MTVLSGLGERSPRQLAALMTGTALLLAGCGGGAGGGGSTDANADALCEEYPAEDVSLVTGAGPTSGFTTWLHTIAPFLSDELGTDVTVENIEGAGHMRALNEVYGREPDGTSIMLIDSGDMILNQMMGRAEPNVDVAEMTHFGQLEAGARVWLVDSNSEVETFSDLADLPQPVRFGANQYNPVSVLTFAAYDLEPTYILIEGTGEIALALKRGDVDVMIGAIPSVMSFLEAGDVKPILYLNTDELSPEDPGYEYLQDAPTPEDTETPEDDNLPEATQMTRTLVGPPGTPECIQEKVSEAVAAVTSDEEFMAAAEEAGLSPTPASAEEAKQQAEVMRENLQPHKDIIDEAAE